MQPPITQLEHSRELQRRLKALVPGNQYAEFCPEVVPAKGETVIVKNYASCFFGTSLASTLTLPT